MGPTGGFPAVTLIYPRTHFLVSHNTGFLIKRRACSQLSFRCIFGYNYHLPEHLNVWDSRPVLQPYLAYACFGPLEKYFWVNSHLVFIAFLANQGFATVQCGL